MASSINASTTAGVVTTADTSGVLNIQTAGTTAISIDASQAVSFTNSPTVTGGTANGVAYLNGSKVLTTSATLTWNNSTQQLGFQNAAANGYAYIGNAGAGTNTDLAFYMGATEGMRLTSTGLAIGSTSANAKLHVYGANTASAYAQTALIQENIYPNSAFPSMAFQTWAGGNSYKSAVGGNGTDLCFYTSSTYGVNPTERARITSGGDFIIQNGSLQVKSTGTTSIDCYPATNSSADFINRNGGGYNFYCGSGLPIRLAVSGAGIVTMSAYGAGTATFNSSGVISSSDGRFKTKTRQVENALASVMALQPTYYRWNDDCPFHTEYEELGFIAQEVGAIIPEASPNEEEENKYKNYSDRAVIAVLVKAMQEMKAIIDTQASTITQLQADVAALKGVTP